MGEDITALRPDLVVTHEPPRTVIVVDLTVPSENSFEGLEKARMEKILNYQLLADLLRRRDYNIYVDGFVVSVLAAWHPWNNRLLTLLRISSGYAGLMRQLIVGNYRVVPGHVEHVTRTR